MKRPSSKASDDGEKKVNPKGPSSKRKKAEKAYAILLGLLEDNVIDLVAHVAPGDPYGVWKVLTDTYEGKSTAKLCHLLDLLMNLRFNEKKEEFDTYRARMTNLVMKLKEMGETISPALQRYVLLKGLPEQFESLVQTLKVNDNLTVEETCIHIKDTCDSRKIKSRSNSTAEGSDSSSDEGEPIGKATASINALAMAKAKKKKAKQAATPHVKEKSRTCFTCGKKGHITYDCPLRKGVVCTNCRKKGHTYIDCKEDLVEEPLDSDEELEALNG